MCVCSILCWSNPKIFLSVLFVFGSDFCQSCFESFSQKVKIFVLNNLVVGSFATHFASGCNLIQVVKWFEEISIYSQIQTKSFATHSRVLRDLDLIHKILPCAFAHFVSNSRVACESLTREMCEKSVLKGSNW